MIPPELPAPHLVPGRHVGPRDARHGEPCQGRYVQVEAYDTECLWGLGEASGREEEELVTT